ncbi:MAG: flagellar basal body rod protein FlgG [Burkholderiaceae bacterium]|nr:flagellar basal body rod protein FlgG [Burkholderiaceae bacterium]
MNNSLYIAATGMQAQQQDLDTIANNLTNLSTPAYKASNVNFQELMYTDPLGARPVQGVPGHAHAKSHHTHAAENTAELSEQPATAYGSGVSVGSITKDFSVGTITQTGAPMDVAIQGSGFIEVTMPDGTLAYTRGGRFGVSKDNYLTSPQGNEIKPSIRLPANPTSITIAPNGLVTATAGSSTQPVQVGQIELANFNNPGALNPIGNGLYLPTDASGRASYGKPGDNSNGTLAQGAVEGSNVNMVNQMVSLMVAQRAYEMSAKVVQTSDELMSMTNNLRRS